MRHLLNPFMPRFSRCVWPQVQLLLAGAILAPGHEPSVPRCALCVHGKLHVEPVSWAGRA